MKVQPATSEERLLQLIRRKSKPVLDKPLAPLQLDAQPSKKGVDFLVWITRILWVIVIGIFLIIFMNFRQEMFITGMSQDVISKETRVDSVKESTQEQVSVGIQVRPFESYRQTMIKRDIFQAPWEKPVMAESPRNNPSIDLSKQYKLVGILLDKDPKAIVEDLTTHQTSFLSIGDRMGSAVVVEIKQDKVIFDFEQERVELVP